MYINTKQADKKKGLLQLQCSFLEVTVVLNKIF